MSELEMKVFSGVKFGICDCDNASCCSSETVCRINPTGCGSDLNSSCSHYFSTVSALEASREIPRYGEFSKNFLDHHAQAVPAAVGNKQFSVVYGNVNTVPKTEVELAEYNSPSANFDHLGGRHGDVWICGRGKKTNDRCGKFRRLKACLRTELHHNSLQGNYGGKAYVKVVHTWCHNPRCPVCFKKGYAVREANNAAEIIQGAKKFHDSVPEHFIYSVSPNDYALSLEQLRAKARKDLMAVGICGGALIFHGFRYRNKYRALRLHTTVGWFWAPHLHCVGFLQGGYAHCRHCKKVKHSDYGKPCESVCQGCGGFENKVRKYGESHGGVIIKIADNGRKRQTIVGTCFYQLHHSSFNYKKVRSHRLTYFGTCGYNKLKIERKPHEDLCPICKHELQKVRYFGFVNICTDIKSSFFKRELFLDAFEDGKPVFEVIEDEKPNFG